MVPVLAACAGACTRSLQLPAQPAAAAAPVLEALDPASAFAGAQLRLTGRGFDPAASANEVRFAAATARGEAFAADGALLVRVPDDAGSGPVVVATDAGRSAPLEAFAYLGLGRLRRGQLVASVPVSHAPSAVLVLGDEVGIASTLLRDAVYSGAPRAASGSRVSTLASSEALASFYEGTQSSSGAATLVRRPREGASVAATLDGARAVRKIVPDGPPGQAPTGLVVLADHLDESSTVLPHLHWRDPSTLAEVSPSTGMGEFRDVGELAALGDGRLAAVASHMTDDGYATDLVLMEPGTPLRTTVLPLPEGRQYSYHAPVAATRGASPARVFAALYGGGVAVFDPDAGFLQELSTFAQSDIAGLAAAPDGSLVALSRPDDAEVAVVAPGTGLVWSASAGTRPSALALDDAGRRLFVADAVDNVVSVFDLATGRPLGRVRFGLELGGQGDPLHALAVSGGDDAVLWVPALGPGGLVPLAVADLQALPGTRRDPGLAPRSILAAGDELWIFDGTAAGAVDIEGTLRTAALPSVYTSAVVLPDGSTLAAVSGGFVQLRGGVVERAVEREGITSVFHLQPVGADRVLVTGALNLSEESVRLWRLDALFDPEGAPVAEYLPGFETLSFVGALGLSEGLTLFLDPHDDDGTRTLLFGADLALRETLPSPVGNAYLLPASPGGQGVAWARYDDTLVHVGLAAPGRAVVETAVVPLPGDISGAAWDPRGERLFVTVDGTDRVFVLE